VLGRRPKVTVVGSFSGRRSLATKETNDGFDRVIDFAVPSFISSSPSPSPEIIGDVAIIDTRAAACRQ
jgi:hypothetical protein